VDHEAVEGSLRRLQTDWIDLYQVGVPDPNTDIDETLGAMSDLVRAGKIRSFGASKVPASEIVEAQWVADRRGHERFRTEQPPYSLLTRAIEYDVLPTCQRTGWASWRTAHWPAVGCRQVPQGAGGQWAGFRRSIAALPGALGREQPGKRRQARRR
jgi:diketogulonate reductase-like aldo/keto reductase